MEKIFGPAVTEILTPFAQDESLDPDLLRNELEFQIAENIGGIFVNGLASEALLMSPEEQLSVVKKTAEVVKGKVPLMANVLSNHTASAVQLVKACEDRGADAVCITQPFVYPYNNDSLLSFFTATAGATRLPVYVYNAPQAGYSLSPKFIAGLIKAAPNIVGYKDSTQDLIHLQTTMGLVGADAGFDVFAGSDGLILPIMQVGGVGIISLISTVFPKLIIELCEAHLAGDAAKAMELQLKVIRVRNILKTGPFMAGYKYAADLIGHPAGKVRAPLVDLTDQDRAKIKDQLKGEGLI